MAPFGGLNSLLCAALALVLLVQGTLGEIACENLDSSTCAFAVSSAGVRCVLEKRVRRSGQVELSCRSSGIEAENLKDWVETDECVEACGLDRSTIGISSDSLLETGFAEKLCSFECYRGCPNIVDLYFNLAAGEGVFLPSLCDVQESSARRGITEIRSSGAACAPTAELTEMAVANSPAVSPSMPPL